MEWYAETLSAAVNEAGARAEVDEKRQQRRRGDDRPGFSSVLDGCAAYLPSSLVSDLVRSGFDDAIITTSKSEDAAFPLFKVVCSGNDIIGKAISSSRELALELASMDYLDLIRMSSQADIPEVGCPEGMLVNPDIVTRLEAEFGTVECDVRAKNSNEGLVEFRCVISCKDSKGVEQMGKAVGSEMKWVRLEAARDLWKKVKVDEFPSFDIHIGESFDHALRFYKNWTTVQDDDDTNTDDEMESLVKEREKEKSIPKTITDDTDEELDDLVNFAVNNK